MSVTIQFWPKAPEALNRRIVHCWKRESCASKDVQDKIIQMWRMQEVALVVPSPTAMKLQGHYISIKDGHVEYTQEVLT